MTPEEIKTRYYLVRSHRYIVQDTWDTIERYIAPYRGRFFKDERSENSVQWRRPFIYDGTAIMASQNLASSLHSSLTSPSAQWFKLRFRNAALNDDNDAVEWLEECAKRVYNALQDSNFNIEINETYQDLVNYGTSIIVEEEERQKGEHEGVRFQSVPIKHCFFESDKNGNVLNFYRLHQWTALEIYDFFDEDSIPDDIVRAAKDAAHDPDQKWDIIFCIYRRMDIEQDPDSNQIAPENRPYGSRYILLNEAEQLGKEGGYYEMPAFIPRWRKTSDSDWGNSPAMVALADTLTLNRMIEFDLMATEKALDPPTLTTSRGLIGDLDLSAGGLTTVRDINEIIPFESRARFDVTDNRIERLRMNIQEYFYIPQLLLPPMEGTPATATEISVRTQQLERIIGPTLGRLQTDLLEPTVTRTFRILYRANQLPPVPDGVDDGAADIEYTSPLARTQEASQVAAIERWSAFILQLAQVNPDVLDVPDWDKMITEGARMLGVSASMVRDEDDIQNERQQRQAQQQAMADAQIVEQQGNAMQAIAGGRNGTNARAGNTANQGAL